MTQLFDTSTYDDIHGPAAADAAATVAAGGRHLRSITVEDDLDARRVEWQLDPTTIEIGRRGIARAREALREAAKGAGADTESGEGPDNGRGRPGAPRRAA